MFKDHSIYFVTGQECSKGRTTLEVVREALDGGVDIVQMREKLLDAAALVSLGRELAALCSAKNATFIVNDDPYLSKEIGSDGVHLGQEDLEKYPLATAREIIGAEKILGVSTHSLKGFREANISEADYIAYGPVFQTKTKDYSIGIDNVETIISEARKPVVFIGGIKETNISQITERGGTNIAVIREISEADDIAEKVKRLKEAVSGQKKEAA